ncbi:MFS transporter [Cyanobacterium stanieri LEGE 03274]|uniref:MFS transporter n=1 Tax=Cyanobacterium stanieri LEGE 03274 TaxID=1828756 RepID=A0ABR9V7D2_9CHRO|nr:MFS transporter [Cyanobacterium stanieri]MBE9223810.1 MFS transporter [Cyanobacterium stanieri LEGE 03274]
MSNSNFYSFIILWMGQGFSLIGSRMTTFALIFWTWGATSQASSLSLLWFFQQLPQILVAPLAGFLVDRCDRKFLMMLGDTVAVLSTLFLLFRELNQQLTIIDLYITTFINSFFGGIQELAYTTTVPLMVASHQYNRANSLEFLAGYGSRIIAPALAGILYPLIHFQGILIVDIITFFIAFLILIKVKIPKKKIINQVQNFPNLRYQITSSYKYIKHNHNLINLLVIVCIFQFFHDVGDAIYAPMILARSNNNEFIYAQIATFAGLGGVLGSLIITTWGGFSRPFLGIVMAMMGAGISKIIFGVGNTAFIWTVAQFFSSLNFPMLGSSQKTVWLKKIPVDIQGKILAFEGMCVLICSLIAYLLGGFLADYIFEPLMMTNNIFSPIFGTSKGAGMSFLYVLCAMGMFLVGLWGYKIFCKID